MSEKNRPSHAQSAALEFNASAAGGKGSSRRTFLKNSLLAGATITLSAKSYSNIIGANDRMNMAVLGLNGRGSALIRSISTTSNTRVTHLCDVDSRAFSKPATAIEKVSGYKTINVEDFRRTLEDPQVHGVAIATPDHWHTPMSILAMDAGKHVYVEKPCGHNPAEGEMLIRARDKYKTIIQMGNQQRSAPTSIQAMKDIAAGLIGDVYYAKAWYSNNRGSIGKGKTVAAPDWLNWDLWQGPAPKEKYRDNLVHYNWHWFLHWGTGEVNNNGAHEIDIARWALGVDYPNKVTSSGGRYHFDDDWQFYDTQNISYEFDGGKMIVWEGRSCNGFEQHQRGRGTTLHGTKGTILLDRNIYQAWNSDGNVIKEIKEAETSETTNTVGIGALDIYHMQNFVDAVRSGTKQNSPIDEGHKSILLCHLGNIAQGHGGALDINPKNGRILGNRKAMKMWQRDYTKKWKPVI